MKKAIGYIRVSTKQQVDDGVSMDMQKDKIKAWCLLNDYELVTTFEDKGLSAKTMRGRTGLLEAIEASGEGYALVCYSMSRISRSVKDMLNIADKLSVKGVDMVSLSEKIDTTTAAGKMVFNMLAVINQFERDQISERTKAAMGHLKKQGKVVGSVPTGFRLNKHNKVVECKKEQAILARVRVLRSRGITLQAISNKLALEGIFNRRNKKYAVASISTMLKVAA